MKFCFVLSNARGSYIIQLFVPSVTWRRSESFFPPFTSRLQSAWVCVLDREYVKLWVALDESDHHSSESNTKRQIEGERVGKEEACFSVRDSEGLYLCDGLVWS